MRGIARFFAITAPSLACAGTAFAQSTQFQGRVTDPSDAVIVGADVRIVNQDNGIVRFLRTNSAGLYTAPFVDPGTYKIYIEAPGFSTAVSVPILLTEGQPHEFDVRLQLGSASEQVTVSATDALLNTTSGTVSTIIGREFVENIPLNGRSFQDLITLAPGVYQVASQGGLSSGEFVVNGQRTESNNFLVDGVSALTTAGTGDGQTSSSYGGAGGVLPGSTILGTTQAILSVDALEEVRLNTSSFSAEFGRFPGGQFQFKTRSGTNAFHGNAFDYFRNNYFDANNWLNDFYQIPQSPLRQNDFGGTLGGPILVPGLSTLRNKAFFFVSYEGLRLLQPQNPGETVVPDLALRQAVAPIVQPFLNAYPKPNQPEILAACDNQTLACPAGSPLGTQVASGYAQFLYQVSAPSRFDATSVKIDYQPNSKTDVFVRWALTPSYDSGYRGDPNYNSANTQVDTLGVNSAFTSRLSNEFRFEYTHSRSDNNNLYVGPLGGATPTNLFTDLGIPSTFANPQANFFAFTPLGILHLQAGLTDGDQHTGLVSDSVSWSLGHHQFKFGMDYRRINSTESPFDPEVVPVFHDLQSLLTGVTHDIGVQDDLATNPVYREYSAYAQDEWRITRHFTLSPGVRWDFDPAPVPGNGVQLYTLAGNLAVPSSLAIVPVQAGRPLFKPGHGTFAPRLGAAWQLHQQPGHETVLRAGGGLYFDTLNQPALYGFGNTESTNYKNATLPLTTAQLNVGPPTGIAPVPPYNPDYIDYHIQLPYTLEWNLSLQQALGNAQTITFAYVGSAARRLFTYKYDDFSAITTDYQIITEIFGTSSSYDSGQVEYQRNLQRGVQALASYTWAHTIDLGTPNSGFNYIRANASTDIRHMLQAGLSWNLPKVRRNRLLDATLSNWGLDGRLQLRTSVPVSINGDYFQVGMLFFQDGVNLVPGQPEYLYGSQYPGKKSLNPAAFVTAAPEAVGTLPRNQLRDFPLKQLNLAARRQFTLVENLRLQFRLEAFNIFNHPNFTGIDTYLGDPNFGRATSTLDQAGSRNSLYESGGPRSLQFVLKVLF